MTTTKRSREELPSDLRGEESVARLARLSDVDRSRIDVLEDGSGDVTTETIRRVAAGLTKARAERGLGPVSEIDLYRAYLAARERRTAKAS